MKTVAWGKWDEEYTAGLPERFADAIGKAVTNLEPGRVGFGRAPVPDLSVNRVDVGGEADAEALLMRIDDDRGRMRAATINFGAHPVTLGADTVICGDYPADAIEKMEGERDELRALFLQGSCGDLNCRGFGEGMEMMRENGSILRDHVLPVLDKIETEPDVVLDGDTYEIPLPMDVPDRSELETELAGYRKELDASEEGQRFQEYRQLRFEVDWRALRLELLDGPHPQRLEFRVSWMRINDAVLLAHPLELFLTYGNQVKAASPYPITMIVGYANETIGYLARPQDFDQEGFGWYAAVFAPRICRHLPSNRMQVVCFVITSSQCCTESVREHQLSDRCNHLASLLRRAPCKSSHVSRLIQSPCNWSKRRCPDGLLPGRGRLYPTQTAVHLVHLLAGRGYLGTDRSKSGENLLALGLEASEHLIPRDAISADIDSRSRTLFLALGLEASEHLLMLRSYLRLHLSVQGRSLSGHRFPVRTLFLALGLEASEHLLMLRSYLATSFHCAGTLSQRT